MKKRSLYRLFYWTLCVGICSFLQPFRVHANNGVMASCYQLLLSPSRRPVFDESLSPDKLNNLESIKRESSRVGDVPDFKNSHGSFPLPTPYNSQIAARMGYISWYSKILPVKDFKEAKRIMDQYRSHYDRNVYPYFVITGHRFSELKGLLKKYQDPSISKRARKKVDRKLAELWSNIQGGPRHRLIGESPTSLEIPDNQLSGLFIWKGRDYLNPQPEDGWHYITLSQAQRFDLSLSTFKNYVNDDGETIGFHQPIWALPKDHGVVDLRYQVNDVPPPTQEQLDARARGDKEFLASAEGLAVEKYFEHVSLRNSVLGRKLKKAVQSGLFHEIRFNISPEQVVDLIRSTTRLGIANSSWITSDADARTIAENLKEKIKNAQGYTIGMFDIRGQLVAAEYGDITPTTVTSDTVGSLPPEQIFDRYSDQSVKLDPIDLNKILAMASSLFFYKAGYNYLSTGMVSSFSKSMKGFYISREEYLAYTLERLKMSPLPLIDWDLTIAPEDLSKEGMSAFLGK